MNFGGNETLTKGFLNFHPNVALEMQCKNIFNCYCIHQMFFFIITDTLKELQNCGFMFLAPLSVYLPKIVKIIYYPNFSNKSPEF